MRPRRLRDAAALWTAMYQMHGTSARDGLWNHPDLLPGADDLDDPVTFAAAHGAAQDLQMPELDDPELGSFRPRDEPADSQTPVTEPGMPAADAATPPPATGSRPRPSGAGQDEPGTPAGSGADDASGSSSGRPDEPGESQSENSGS
jgi:hypothetical protein